MKLSFLFFVVERRNVIDGHCGTLAYNALKYLEVDCLIDVMTFACNRLKLTLVEVETLHRNDKPNKEWS